MEKRGECVEWDSRDAELLFTFRVGVLLNLEIAVCLPDEILLFIVNFLGGSTMRVQMCVSVIEAVVMIVWFEWHRRLICFGRVGYNFVRSRQSLCALFKCTVHFFLWLLLLFNIVFF